jgi:hypothetical protein
VADVAVNDCTCPGQPPLGPHRFDCPVYARAGRRLAELNRRADDLGIGYGAPVAAARHPRPGDPIVIRGDRRTVLAVRDGRVLAHDDAGFALSRRTDTLWFDGEAWRAFGDRS